LFDLLRAFEAHSRLAQRLFARQAARHASLRQNLEVGLHFIVELLFYLPPIHQSTP
jgi:hypothetical protein